MDENPRVLSASKRALAASTNVKEASALPPIKGIGDFGAVLEESYRVEPSILSQWLTGRTTND